MERQVVSLTTSTKAKPTWPWLYIGPVLKLFSFEPKSREVQLLLYVDDGTILTQSPTLSLNLSKLTKAYGVIYWLLTALGLVLEHDKSEVYHFSWSRGKSHPPIDLGFAPYMGDTPLSPKLYWRYLGFTSTTSSHSGSMSSTTQLKPWPPSGLWVLEKQ